MEIERERDGIQKKKERERWNLRKREDKKRTNSYSECRMSWNVEKKEVDSRHKRD